MGPPGADLDTFDWRISRAIVTADSPFSLFPSIDRTLVVCAGAGLRLQPGDAPAFTVEASGAPARFAADVPHHATLLGGAVTDLNVMTRRGRAAHRVVILAAADLAILEPDAALRFLVCVAGSIGMDAAERTHRLETDDALRIEASADLRILLSPSVDARAALIEIRLNGA